MGSLGRMKDSLGHLGRSPEKEKKIFGGSARKFLGMP
jgi:hypothetical protein